MHHWKSGHSCEVSTYSRFYCLFEPFISPEPEHFLETKTTLTRYLQISAHSLTRSLTHSLTQSLSHSVAQSLSHSVSQSLSHSVTQPLSQSVNQSVTQSLSHSGTQSLSHSLAPSLPHSLAHSLTRSLTRLNSFDAARRVRVMISAYRQACNLFNIGPGHLGPPEDRISWCPFFCSPIY